MYFGLNDHIVDRIAASMVIEGVETKTQLDVVNGAGCEIIQEFYYFRPQAIDELVQKI